jgi:hypothetical protein
MRAKTLDDQSKLAAVGEVLAGLGTLSSDSTFGVVSKVAETEIYRE